MTPANLERLKMSNKLGALIHGCTDGLPENQRDAFLLREVERFESAEICADPWSAGPAANMFRDERLE